MNKPTLPSFPGVLNKKDSDHLNRLLEVSADLNQKSPVPPSNPIDKQFSPQKEELNSKNNPDMDLPPPIPSDNHFFDYTKQNSNNTKVELPPKQAKMVLPQSKHKKDEFDFSEDLKKSQKEIPVQKTIVKEKSDPVKKQQRTSNKSSSLLSKINVILILISLGASGYLYLEKQKVEKRLNVLQNQVNNNESTVNTTKSNVNYLMNKSRASDQEGKGN